MGTVAMLAEDFEHAGQLHVAAGADVVDLAGLAFLDEQTVGADDVADVGEVADDVEVADLDTGSQAALDFGDLAGEAGEGVEIGLAGARVVEGAGHEGGGAVGQAVLDAEQVDGGLAGGVRVIGAFGASFGDGQVLGRRDCRSRRRS